jgi:hypothetical protein
MCGLRSGGTVKILIAEILRGKSLESKVYGVAREKSRSPSGMTTRIGDDNKNRGGQQESGMTTRIANAKGCAERSLS